MEEIGKLHDSLDALWEEYLGLLDIYTKNQRQLQQHFSSGFFSLARANARSSIGRRYGSDWYDNRSKATTRTIIEAVDEASPNGLHNEPCQSIISRIVNQPQYIEQQPDTSGESPAPTEKVQQPTPPSTPPRADSTSGHEAVDESTSERHLQKDPLFWFGLLPTPDLRATQSRFKAVVHGQATKVDDVDEKEAAQQISSPLAETVNAARDMRAVELEIRKLRKTIRQAERVQSS